jgi:hypothetical protein
MRNYLYGILTKSFLLIFISFTIVATNTAHADEWRKNFTQTKLIGSGELRWFGFSIYTAKLWQEAIPFNPKLSFALEINYQRSISKQRFVDSSIEEIQRLHGGTFSKEVISKWRKYMESAFTDVQSGDQLIGVFLPNIGCRFYNQNKLLAEIADKEFAQAFFSIWFDPRSKDQALRESLMGKS